MSEPVDRPIQRRKPKPEVTTIGGRELKPATLMMGYGYDPVLSEGSLKPPIFLTSTFVFESAEAGKRHFEGITGKRAGGAEGLVYSRFNGPNQEILEDRLRVWDGAEDALVFSSGMTAICILMMAYCEAGDVIVHSGPLYAASEGFVAKVLAKFGVSYVDFPAGATREELDAVLALRNTMGGICDPNTAGMLLRSLETLEIRMRRATENAIRVCDFLKDHPKVEGLGFLGLLREGSQLDIYRRHCTGPGSTFSLFIRGGEAEAFRFLDALRVAKLAVSLGGTETLASHPAAMTHLSVPDERRTQLGITDNLVRVSIGIEDPDDLIADFEQALAAV